MSGLIPLAVMRGLDFAAPLGGDHDLDPVPGTPCTDSVGVIATLAVQPLKGDTVEGRLDRGEGYTLPPATPG